MNLTKLYEIQESLLFHSNQMELIWGGAQCQQSDLRWTKVKQAQASHKTKTHDSLDIFIIDFIG